MAEHQVIVDLYQGYYDAEPLGAGDRILSFDAKPQINARRRLHPTLPAAPGRPVRYEHEYKRKGSLALLAGLDVRTGQVFASTPLTTGIIKPFMDLARQVMARPGYKDAPRVFVIVDNGSDHRGQAAVTRLARAHPNAIMIHTPVHASWLNQIEIFFSVIQKKSLRPTTSTASNSCPGPCWPSSTGTTRPPGRSAGNSPPATCTTSWTASASTTSQTHKTNRCHRPHDNLRRTYRPTHLSREPSWSGTAAPPLPTTRLRSRPGYWAAANSAAAVPMSGPTTWGVSSSQLAEQVKATAVKRSNARGGRGPPST